MNSDKRVSYLELMYPIMQSYDSVAVKADLELGGTDQRFNLLTGRDIQRFYGQEPQDIMTTQLMEGTDGRKMSSSWGNTVNITEEPNNMFGKIMSIPDSLIKKYFILATRVPLSEIDEILKLPNPRDQKLKLAEEITKLYHGEKKALAAKEAFINQFSKGELPEEIETKKIKSGTYKLSELMVLTGQVSSKSEARRLIEQNGVKVNQKTSSDVDLVLDGQKEYLLQVGKRKFVKII
jgi:tyrosyl-tRNA synthetase